jgi:hypothetical protein
MEHQWTAKFGKAISAECAALRALSNNENRTATAFKTVELSITEYDISKFISTPSTFGTGNGNEAGGIFYPVWRAWLLDGLSMLCAQPEETPFKTLGVIHERHTQTNTQIDRADRSNTQIHSWMNLPKKLQTQNNTSYFVVENVKITSGWWCRIFGQKAILDL